ncbi:hypothetical protein [Kineococcus sp. SYSU DK003]|uniref:hypothetical protein n=1 Tax=Kineococcus sp. SYSU DK003 TaxID=3383124 RepID=UPI003D7F05C5
MVVAERESASPIMTVAVSVHLRDDTEIQLPALAGFAVDGRNRGVQRLAQAAEQRRFGGN